MCSLGLNVFYGRRQSANSYRVDHPKIEVKELHSVLALRLYDRELVHVVY